jgi:hypothetical protein
VESIHGARRWALRRLSTLLRKFSDLFVSMDWEP